MKSLLAALCLLALAGCSAPQRAETGEHGSASTTATDAVAPASAPAPSEPMGRAAQGGDAPAPPATTTPGAPVTGVGMAPTTPMLAYSYGFDIQAPSDRARALMLRHQAACAAAGPAQCQVVSANESKTDQDQFSGNLQLRAAPGWLDRFRAGLDQDAAGAGGHVIGSRVESEDLTRAIVDSDAALRARTTLRTRLEALLATRPGELSDLLEVERELARVQGEIDATQSELAVMRTRVATSAVTLNYGSRGVLARPDVFQPIIDALNSSLSLLAQSVGAIIHIIAVLAPWVLVIGGLLWLFRKRLPKFGRRPAVTVVPPPQPPISPPPAA